MYISQVVSDSEDPIHAKKNCILQAIDPPALLRKLTSNEILFYKFLNSSISDSMNEFILTMLIEISIKSYINCEFPRSGQKNFLK